MESVAFSTITTALTGNLDGYFTIQAFGSLLVVFVFVYIIVKIMKLYSSLMDATQKYTVDQYKNKAYLDTMYTAYKAGVVRSAAKVEDINLDEEIKNIPPASSAKNIAEVLKEQVAKEISK